MIDIDAKEIEEAGQPASKCARTSGLLVLAELQAGKQVVKQELGVARSSAADAQQSANDAQLRER